MSGRYWNRIFKPVLLLRHENLSVTFDFAECRAKWTSKVHSRDWWYDIRP